MSLEDEQKHIPRIKTNLSESLIKEIQNIKIPDLSFSDNKPKEPEKKWYEKNPLKVTPIDVSFDLPIWGTTSMNNFTILEVDGFKDKDDRKFDLTLHPYFKLADISLYNRNERGLEEDDFRRTLFPSGGLKLQYKDKISITGSINKIYDRFDINQNYNVESGIKFDPVKINGLGFEIQASYSFGDNQGNKDKYGTLNFSLVSPFKRQELTQAKSKEGYEDITYPYRERNTYIDNQGRELTQEYAEATKLTNNGYSSTLTAKQPISLRLNYELPIKKKPFEVDFSLGVNALCGGEHSIIEKGSTKLEFFELRTRDGGTQAAVQIVIDKVGENLTEINNKTENGTLKPTKTPLGNIPLGFNAGIKFRF